MEAVTRSLVTLETFEQEKAFGQRLRYTHSASMIVWWFILMYAYMNPPSILFWISFTGLGLIWLQNMLFQGCLLTKLEQRFLKTKTVFFEQDGDFDIESRIPKPIRLGILLLGITTVFGAFVYKGFFFTQPLKADA